MKALSGVASTLADVEFILLLRSDAGQVKALLAVGASHGRQVRVRGMSLIEQTKKTGPVEIANKPASPILCVAFRCC